MIGLIGSFLSRALPYIPRIANFVKSGIAHGIPAILKGVSKVKEFAQKALPIVGAVQAGIETAKSLPKRRKSQTNCRQTCCPTSH